MIVSDDEIQSDDDRNMIGCTLPNQLVSDHIHHHYCGHPENENEKKRERKKQLIGITTRLYKFDYNILMFIIY